jgi:hypothetical protein
VHEIILTDGETVHKKLLKSGLAALFGIQQPSKKSLAQPIEPRSPLLMPATLASGNYRFYSAPTHPAITSGSMLMPRSINDNVPPPLDNPPPIFPQYSRPLAAQPQPLPQAPPAPLHEPQPRVYRPVPDPHMLRGELLRQLNRSPGVVDMEVSACREAPGSIRMPQTVSSH